MIIDNQTELYMNISKKISHKTFLTLPEVFHRLSKYSCFVLANYKNSDVISHSCNLLAIELNINISDVQNIKEEELRKLKATDNHEKS